MAAGIALDLLPLFTAVVDSGSSPPAPSHRGLASLEPISIGHHGTLSRRHRQERLHPEGRLEGISRLARAGGGREAKRGPVSAPCTWQEIEREGVGPRTFTLRTLAGRIGEVGDLWRAMDSQRCSLHGPLTSLQRLLTEEDWNEAMAASTRRPVSRKP